MNEDDPRGALVYAEATRTLDLQEALLENVQGRSATLLSAASIATLFLAGLAIREREGLTVLAAFAATAFIFVVAVCVWLLVPGGRWIFRFEGSLLVQNCLDADPPPTLAKMHRDLSKQMDRWAVVNEKKLDTMLRWFTWASVALGVEAALWIANLVWRG
jgi:hypothetical protein